ncbi:hypothetical protein DB346_15315 [Verrucomicrobia bacterium LW23]|nr:hypothetical protein DB346_15315 [Verrucomicrobia bacterium LW23]
MDTIVRDTFNRRISIRCCVLKDLDSILKKRRTIYCRATNPSFLRYGRRRFRLHNSYFHQLIMPMGKTSDDVRQDSCHLWLIDERLAFHNYLAPDKPLSSYAGGSD